MPTAPRQQATISLAQQLAAESRAAGTGRADLALLLALEARRVRPGPEADGALETALLSVPPGVERVFDFGARRYWTFDPAIKTKLVVDLGHPDTLALFDPATGKVARELTGWTGGSPVGQAVSPDQRWVSAGTAAGTILAWDAATGRRIGGFDTRGDGPAYGGFDPTDTNRLIVAGHDGRVVVWHLDDPTAPPIELYRAPASTTPDYPNLVRLSADGTQVAVSDPIAGPTHIVDTHSGGLRRVVPGTAGDFSADGSVVLTSTADGVHRWDLATGSQVGPTMSGLGRPGPLATFSPNGRYVAVGDLSDQHVYVFAVDDDGKAIFSVEAHNAIPLPTWRPDGLLTVQGGHGAVVTRVDRGGLPPLALPLGGGGIAGATDRADRFVTLDAGIGTWTIDGKSGAPITRIPDPGGAPIAFVQPSPDRRFVAVRIPGSPRPVTTVWEHGRPKPLGVIEKAADDPPDEFWTPDSRTLVVVHKETVDLWRPRGGSLDRYAQLHPDRPVRAAAGRHDRGVQPRRPYRRGGP